MWCSQTPKVENCVIYVSISLFFLIKSIYIPCCRRSTIPLWFRTLFSHVFPMYFGRALWHPHRIPTKSYLFSALLFNIAMENGPFIDGLPTKKWWFSMAMLHNQMVSFYYPAPSFKAFIPAPCCEQNLSEASPQPHSSSEAAEDPPSWSGNSPGKPQRRCWWMNLFLSHMIHGAGIFTTIYPINGPNVSTYTRKPPSSPTQLLRDFEGI